MIMKKVNVAMLKENLSSYLHEVQAGKEIVVTSHQRPVARVVAYDQDDLVLLQATRPVRDLMKIKGVRLPAGPSSLDLLLEDRKRR